MKRNIFMAALLVFAFTVACAQQWNGLTLIGRGGNPGGGGGGTIYDTLRLIDTNGVSVKFFKCNAGGSNSYANHLTKGGNFYRTLSAGGTLTGGGIHGRVQKFGWNGNLLWDWTYASASYSLHHDFCPLPNGNVLFICYDVLPAGSATTAGGTFASAVWSEKIVEVQPTGATTGNIVWEWKLWDRLMQKTNATGANYFASAADHPERLDVVNVTTKDFAHINGIDFDSARNQIILSSHFLDEIYVIDHTTTTAEAASHTGGASGKGGDFLYRYGRTGNYSAGTAGNVNDVIHDAHLVKYGPYKGGISFFHNKALGASASAADIIMPPRNGNDYTITAGSAFQPLSYTKRYDPSGYTSNMGSTEEFPNGNVMVSLALTGVVKELDSNSNILWTYSAGGSLAQAHRYDMCEITTAKPVVPAWTSSGTTLTIENTNNYGVQWLKNGVPISGATSNTYDAGTNYAGYSVEFTDTFFCAITGQSKFYAPLGISDMQAIAIEVYPNPCVNVVSLKGFTANTKLNAVVFDMNGKQILSATHSKIDVSNLATGAYVIEAIDEQGKKYVAQFNKQ
jgi:hypothetical protein